ncbi:MAG: hypothetical protein HYZ36_05100 [Pedosphaera parvula]|nr:hypothetical protein [Pedosphaera parvula]
MNKKTAILLAAVAIVAGCSKVESPKTAAKPPTPTAPLPSMAQEQSAAAPQNAPALASAVAATVAAEAPAATADANAPKRLTEQEVTMLNYAVYKYKEQFGRFPKSLQDMIGTPHLARVPVTPPDQKLVYDPTSGLVSVAKP